MVCTANRFRSPLLEGYLKAYTHGLPVEVSSAGMQRREGVTALPEAVALAAESGIDIARHRARRLTRSHLDTVDLVVGFERVHVSHSVVEGKARYDRTFGIVELVRLLEVLETIPGEDPVGRARNAVALAHARRAPLRVPWVHMEIADPLGGPPTAIRKTAMVLNDLGWRLAAGLFGVTPQSS